MNNQISKDLETLQFNMYVGMEGMGDIVTYLGKAVSLVALVAKEVAKMFIPISVYPDKVGSLVRTLRGLDVKVYGDVPVYAQSGVRTHMTPYYQTMMSTLDVLVDLEDRIHKPFIKYMEHAVTTESEADVIWLDKDLEFTHVDSHTKKLGDHFKKNRDTSHSGAGEARFDALYSSATDYENAGDLLYEICDKLNEIDLKSLAKSEARLADAIRVYVDTATDNPDIVSKNKQTIRKMVEAVNAAAKETELLGVLIFNITASISAHNETHEKLKDIMGGK